MQKITKVLTMLCLLVTCVAYAETSNLATQTGKDIGLTLAYYQYEEPRLMSLKGAKIGLDFSATKAWQNEQFIRAELRSAYGRLNYNSYGTGSVSGEPDWYIEARGMMGKDWSYNNDVIAAYIGLGYRYLFNDGRGATSSGALGYRRKSSYVYLPIGIIYRSNYDARAKLVTTLEYDHFLIGRQISKLSDIGLGLGDVRNSQRSGYGLKLSIQYEKDRLSFGPYLNSWNIDRSNWMPLYQYGLPVFDSGGFQLGGVEPQNDTIELGLKVSQKF